VCCLPAAAAAAGTSGGGSASASDAAACCMGCLLQEFLYARHRAYTEPCLESCGAACCTHVRLLRLQASQRIRSAASTLLLLLLQEPCIVLRVLLLEAWRHQTVVPSCC
jgi:hypothetical protein